MKKCICLVIFMLMFQAASSASYNDVLVADIQYDWIRKTDVEKQALIQEVHDIIFADEVAKKKGLKKTFKSMLKDKDYVAHYLAASAGYSEYKEYNISAFYAGKQKHIYMYALQDKKDLSKAYYYDALGHLRYVDFYSEGYPDYPYYAIQYRITGAPVSAIYYASKDNQYLYEPNGKFKGVWYKHNLYDEHSKIILKRTAY